RIRRGRCMRRFRVLEPRRARTNDRRRAARGRGTGHEYGNGEPGEGKPMRLQRSIDVAVAATGLVLSSPLLCLIAWMIRLDDGGPVLFTQTRVGTARAPFRIYKFRTMRDGATTRVGRWLRQTGLDELPQLINMLRG